MNDDLSLRYRVDPKELKKLYTKATYPWMFDVIFDWTIIVLAIWLFCAFKNPLTFLIAIFLVGNRQHALVILGHEATHFTVFNNKKLNDLASNLLNMWIVGISVEGYRALHFQHHKGLGTEADPELHHKRSRAPQWDLPMPAWRIFLYTIQDLFGYAVPDYFIIVTYSKPPTKRDLLLLVIFHLVAITTCLAFGLIWPLIIWYVSIVTTFMIFFRLRLWIEHQGTERTTRLHLSWWQAFLLSPHNGWYHWEHHNWAAVPYHNLPKLRKLIPSPEVFTLKDLIRYLKTAPKNKSGMVFNPNRI